MGVKVEELKDYLIDSYINFIGVYKGVVKFDNQVVNGTTNFAGAFLIPVQGSAIFNFGDEDIFLKPGVLLHAAPNKSMKKLATSIDTNWTYILVYYDISDDSYYEDTLINKNFTMSFKPSTRLFDLAEQLEQQYYEHNDFKAKMIFYKLLDELVKCIESYYNKNDYLNQIKQYVDNNYFKELSVLLLSDIFNIERRRLAKEFENRYKIGLKEYILEVRMEHAKVLIEEGYDSIIDIAREVGYKDPSYFTKIFKRETGINPNDYINE